MAGTCNAPGCDRSVRTRGHCGMHYQRLLRTGRLDVPTWQDKFWQQVAKSDTCWLWTGYICPDGYGRFKRGGRPHNAHRVAYELLIGEIPDGLQLDHLCRVKACLNPEHLEPVTAAVNTKRVPNHPIVLNAAKTHCPRGHAYTGDNLRMSRDGHRHCKACHRAVEQRRRDEGRVKPRGR